MRRHHYIREEEDDSVLPIYNVTNNSVTNGVYQDVSGGGIRLPPEHTVRIFCRANDGYCMSIRDGAVVLAPNNPKDNDYQAIYHHHYHPSPESGQAPPPPSSSSPPLPPSPAYKIFCRANAKYNLTIRNDTVVLAPANENDQSQHWMRYNTDEIKDENGSSAFSLVNKYTGQAIKHSFGHNHPVRLLPYNPDYLDESMLWTESKDMGDGFRGIRMVNNINLHFDAIRGDKHHEGVHDGTGVILFKWWEGGNFNQQWKIIPW